MQKYAKWGNKSGLILGLHPANERRRYKVTPSLIGSVQAIISSALWIGKCSFRSPTQCYGHWDVFRESGPVRACFVTSLPEGRFFFVPSHISAVTECSSRENHAICGAWVSLRFEVISHGCSISQFARSETPSNNIHWHISHCLWTHSLGLNNLTPHAEV